MNASIKNIIELLYYENIMINFRVARMDARGGKAGVEINIPADTPILNGNIYETFGIGFLILLPKPPEKINYPEYR